MKAAYRAVCICSPRNITLAAKPAVAPTCSKCGEPMQVFTSLPRWYAPPVEVAKTLIRPEPKAVAHSA